MFAYTLKDHHFGFKSYGFDCNWDYLLYYFTHLPNLMISPNVASLKQNALIWYKTLQNLMINFIIYIIYYNNNIKYR